MVHDLDPFLFRIYGDFGVRWYGLAYMVGFLAGYYLIRWMALRHRALIKADQVADFITYIAIGTLVGGRLGYCLFYSPDLFTKFKPTFPFWGVLAVNEGGMASHGGMIGIIVACVLFGAKHRINRLHLFDLVTLTGPIGVFFGRIANFINGELVGRPCAPDFPLAVKFPQDILLWPKNEPGRLADLANVVDKIGIPHDQWLEWVAKFRFDSGVRGSLNSGLSQIIDAIQSGNTAAKEAIAPLLTPRYPSQLFGALGEGLFIFLVLFIFWRKPRKPGVVSALFVTLYGIVRISDEMFRMPDDHIGYQWLGLTRGQWLSTVMVAAGIFLLILWGKRRTLPVSGWSRRY